MAQQGKDATEISRKEEVWVGTGGMITIAGGKLTGFRTMAITVLDFVAERLGRSLEPSPGPDPIPGGDLSSDIESHVASVVAATGIVRPLADRSGTALRERSQPRCWPGVTSRSVPGGRVVDGEVEWAVQVDGALTLEDLIYRRTRAAWYTPSEREALLAPTAALMGNLLGWDSFRAAAEVDGVRARFASELQFKANP